MFRATRVLCGRNRGITHLTPLSVAGVAGHGNHAGTGGGGLALGPQTLSLPTSLLRALRGLHQTTTTSAARSVGPAQGVDPASCMAFLNEQWPDHPCHGLMCHEVSAQHVLVSQDVPPSSVRPGGYISGPTQFSLADLGMWFGVFGVRGFEAMAMTSELSIRYLRPATGTTLWVRCQMIRKAIRALKAAVCVHRV